MSQVTSPIILDSTGRSIASGLAGLADAISSRPAPAEDTPIMDGVGAVGTSLKYAREDHVHPSDTSRASANILDYETNTIAADEGIGVNVGFTVDSAAPLKDLKVTITPVQSGSGDPSPSNIRPITGWTGVSVYHSGGDTSNPDTINVSWVTEAGAVAGGTLNVLTGVLTVTQIYFQFDGTETAWIASSSGANKFYRFTAYNILTTGSLARACSHYPNATVTSGNTGVGYYAYTTSGGSNAWLNFRPNLTDIPDLAAWKTFLANQAAANTPVTCYFTPTEATRPTYQLTPHQMETFAGINNIWSTANGISVTYRLGTNALLQDVSETAASLRSEFGLALIPKANQAQIAIVETGDKASQAYAVGDYFCRNGLLYRVTAAISSGQTFTVNTNCVETTIMAEIIRLTT